jgi:hypothetical protein
VGDRVEVTAILGGQEVPQAGLFKWSFNDVDAGILKYPWSAEAGTARPLGLAGLTWTPVILGSAGIGYFTNRFQDGVLAGNESTYTTYSVGVPVRNLIGASVSVAPRWVQSSTDRGSDEDVKGRKGSRPQTRPWRSERRLGRGRGDQATRW